jgi:uncharacterized protein (TIGR02466 family)
LASRRRLEEGTTLALIREIERDEDGSTLLGLFETPVMVRHVPDHEGLNESLSRTFLAMEQDAERWQDKRTWSTKFGALFESTFDLFDSEQEDISLLRDHCLSAVHDVAARLNSEHWLQAGLDVSRFTTVIESWFHIMRDGGRHGLHKHGNNSWSGVYFVEPGESSEDQPANGLLRLYDPRPNISMFHDMAMIPFGIGSVDITPEAGKLVIFPSWLQHEVLTYHGDLPRISVAWNVSIRSGDDS